MTIRPPGISQRQGAGASLARDAPEIADTSPRADAEEPGGYDRVARNGLMSMVALVAIGGSRILYGSIVSRATDVETYGFVGLVLALAMIASFAIPAGVAAATSRFIPFNRGRRDDALARGLLVWQGRVSVVTASTVAAGAGVGAVAFLALPEGVAVQAILLTFLYSLYTTDKAALYAVGMVGSYMRIEVVTSILVLLITIPVALSGSWLLGPWLVGYAAFSLIARFAVRTHRRGPSRLPDRRERAEVFGYVALASIGTLASAGFLQSTQPLAALLTTPTELGYVAAAVTLTAPLYFLPRALSLALFPFLSSAHGAGDAARIREHANVATRGLVAVMVIVVTFGQLLAEPTLFLFGGAGFLGATPALQIMLIGVFLAVVQVPSVNTLSSGPSLDIRIPVSWAVAGSAVGMLIIVIGGSIGATGIAIGFTAGACITALGPVGVVWRRYQMDWRDSFARAVLALGIAAAAAAVLATTDANDRLVPWIASLVSVVALATILFRRDLVNVVQTGRRAARAGPDPVGGDPRSASQAAGLPEGVDLAGGPATAASVEDGTGTRTEPARLDHAPREASMPASSAGRLNVLAVTNLWPGPGGYPGGFIRDQVEAIRELGHSVDVERVAGPRGRLDYLAANLRVARRVRSGEYDLIHVHFGMSAITTMLAGNTPKVVSLYGSDVNVAWKRWISRLGVRGSGALIFVSRRLAQRFGAPDAVVIPNGVDFELFAPGDRAAARRMLGIGSDDQVVLFGADPQRAGKGYDLFVDVLRSLANRGLNARPLILTEPYQTVDRVLMKLDAADVLLFTSDQGTEGSPTVVKEAVSMGLPVASVDVGDVAEVLANVHPSAVVGFPEAGDRSRSRARLVDRLADGAANVLASRRRADGRTQAAWLERRAIAVRIARVYERVVRQ